jgi:hypothetical protein
VAGAADVPLFDLINVLRSLPNAIGQTIASAQRVVQRMEVSERPTISEARRVRGAERVADEAQAALQRANAGLRQARDREQEAIRRLGVARAEELRLATASGLNPANVQLRAQLRRATTRATQAQQARNQAFQAHRTARRRRRMAVSGRNRTRAAATQAIQSAQAAQQFRAAMAGTAGAVALAAGTVHTFASALAISVVRLRQFAESINESNRLFASYSGRLGYAFTMMEVNQVGRDFRYAAFTQDSAVRLVNAIDRMRESFMKFNNNWGDIVNKFAGFGAGVAGGFGGELGKLIEQLNRILDNFNIDAAVVADVIGKFMGAFAGIPAIAAGLKAILDHFKLRAAKQDDNEQKMGAWDEFALAMAGGNGQLLLGPVVNRGAGGNFVEPPGGRPIVPGAGGRNNRAGGRFRDNPPNLNFELPPNLRAPGPAPAGPG